MLSPRTESEIKAFYGIKSFFDGNNDNNNGNVNANSSPESSGFSLKTNEAAETKAAETKRANGNASGTKKSTNPFSSRGEYKSPQLNHSYAMPQLQKLMPVHERLGNANSTNPKIVLHNVDTNANGNASHNDSNRGANQTNLLTGQSQAPQKSVNSPQRISPPPEYHSIATPANATPTNGPTPMNSNNISTLSNEVMGNTRRSLENKFTENKFNPFFHSGPGGDGNNENSHKNTSPGKLYNDLDFVLAGEGVGNHVGNHMGITRNRGDSTSLGNIDDFEADSQHQRLRKPQPGEPNFERNMTK
jgi:hypothetical protein